MDTTWSPMMAWRHRWALLIACITLIGLVRADSMAFTPDSPLSPAQMVKLMRRQAITGTKVTGPDIGGSNSAAAAASAAGDNIDTGSGGARSTPNSPEEFAKLLSGVFFGSLLTLILGGAFAVQVWHYLERFGRRGSDRLALQIAVGTLLFFSVLQVAVLIHRLYDIHVKHFGDFAFPLLTVGWELCVSFICIAVNSCIVQIYYAHRVWLAFNKNKVLLAFSSILITFTLVGGCASAALIILAGSAANVKGQALHQFQPNSVPWQFSVVFATWLCTSAFIDVALCFSLIWQLNKMSTPFFHTRYAVARLLLLSLETCLTTTTLSLASMITFLTVPYQFFYLIPFLPIGQVTASSLLATLMARPSIARELAQDQVGMPLQGGLEEASASAPKSLAKPVVKKMMRKERKKAPKGDGTGVHMTLTMCEELSDPAAQQAGMLSPNEKAGSSSGSLNQATAYMHGGNHNQNNHPYTFDSFGLPEMPEGYTDQEYDASRQGQNDRSYTGTKGPGSSVEQMTNEGPSWDMLRMPHRERAGTQASNSTYGRTPRGRLVQILDPTI